MESCREILFLLLCVTVFTSSVSSDHASFSSDNNETFRNILLIDSSVIVGSTDKLYRLNLELEEEDSRQLSTPNRMLVVDPYGTYMGSVLACETLDCTLSAIDNLSDIRWQVSSGMVQEGTENVAGIFAPGPNGTSTLTLSERETDTPLASRIIKGDLVNVDGSDFSFDRYAIQTESDLRRQREFLTAFTFQRYVYFVTRLVMSNTRVEIRVVRFCEGDRGVMPVGALQPLFTSHYEIELECSAERGNEQTMYSAAFFNTSEPFGTETLILAVAEMSINGYMEHVCAYDINDINERFTRKFDTCIDGGEEGDDQIGFEREILQDCLHFSPHQIMNSVSHIIEVPT